MRRPSQIFHVYECGRESGLRRGVAQYSLGAVFFMVFHARENDGLRAASRPPASRQRSISFSSAN